MTDILLFHHAQGLTEGVRAFADRLRDAGHEVTVPDLYGGRTFATVEEGVEHAEGLGFQNIVAACLEAAEEMSERMVYAGMSLGVMPAQKLAQSRAGALGLLAMHAAVPLDAFGDASWPDGVKVQIHLNEGDEFDDRDVASEFVEVVGGSAEMFVYPGSTHLFSDNSLADYEEESAEVLLERALQFLASCD